MLNAEAINITNIICLGQKSPIEYTQGKSHEQDMLGLKITNIKCLG